MTNIHDILATLSRKRPIFHSEADFQHALAWEVQLVIPNAKIRLELPFEVHNTSRKRGYLDVWVETNRWNFALELKYKTRGFMTKVDNEVFNIADHSAQDLGRYDFIKDVQRLENLVAANRNTFGYAILLTNDSAYWKSPPQRSKPTAYEAFRLEEGYVLHGSLEWGVTAGPGTRKGREDILNLRGTYPVQWKNYSQLDRTTYGSFRYATVQVNHSEGVS